MNLRSLALVSIFTLTAATAFAQEAPAPENAPAAAAAATTVAPAAAPAPIVTAGGEFRIGTADVLDIQVWKNQDLSRVVPVRPDGWISLPLVNDIKAAGLTPNELKTQITERLVAFVPAAEVSVIVREIHSSKVSITGAVRMPGWYEINSDATFMDMVARAQGFSDFAKANRIVLQRKQPNGSTRVIEIDFDKVAQGKAENIAVQNGDVIFVP